MQGNKLDGLRVAILVSTDFEQAELTEPRKALEQAGATTTIISPQPGQITGMNHDQKADTFNVDMTLDQANPNNFDAVLLPGGALNADFMRMNPKAQDFVKQIDSSGRP
ncbi:MAG TPA: DJ-1/PfpI family protein, partial [Ktedonobacteraceae bacterium]